MTKVIPRTYKQGYEDGRESLLPQYKEMLEALRSVQRYIEGAQWDDTDISSVIKKAGPDADL